MNNIAIANKGNEMDGFDGEYFLFGLNTMNLAYDE
jgi:hypothetical protein